MPRLLDLFCGAGGAAWGYNQAGFDVYGVDIRPQPHYPFVFDQHDAFETSYLWMKRFDLIHASPPCQRYSSATPAGSRKAHPDHVAAVRAMLEVVGVPYVIENVPQAPLRPDLMLCGVMFGLPIARHRIFESTVPLEQPEHPGHPEGIVQITGGGPCNYPPRPGIGGARRKPNADEARRIMGMPWATKAELNEALPPAYTELIGRQILGREYATVGRSDSSTKEGE